MVESGRNDMQELKDILEEAWDEMRHALWMSGVPVNIDGDDDSDDDTSDDGDDGADGDDDDDPVKKAQAEVDKAYAKLREEEKARKAAEKRAAELERKGMPDAEAAKAEAAELRAKVEEYEAKEAETERRTLVVAVAKKLKFRTPEKAVGLVGKDLTDEKSITDALKDWTKEIPELVGAASPPPPINEGGKETASSMNKRMNDSIRAAAGRG